MGIWSHFKTFHDRIKLSNQDDAYKAARERDDSITSAVKTAFEEAGYCVIDDFIQGSFSTHTAILNKTCDFDIDRAIVIDGDAAPENPVTAKKVLCTVLDNRGFKNATIKMPCVTADYLSEKLHIDFPIYKKHGENLYLAIGRRNSDENNRKWEISQPIELASWIKDKSNYSGSPELKLQQFNRIVRYLKRWRDVQFSEQVASKVYSIGLTVMAKHAFSPVFDQDNMPDDLTALKKTVDSILSSGDIYHIGQEQYKVSVHLPVEPRRDIFDGSSVDIGTQLRNKLVRLKNKLIDAINESDERKKCIILNNILGEDFPIPDTSSNSSNSGPKKAVYSTYGAVGTHNGA